MYRHRTGLCACVYTCVQICVSNMCAVDRVIRAEMRVGHVNVERMQKLTWDVGTRGQCSAPLWW